MRKAAIFDSHTGKIIALISGLMDDSLNATVEAWRNIKGDHIKGAPVSPEVTSATHCFVEEEAVLRPEMPLAIPNSGTVGQPYRVEGIPEGTTLHYPGGEVVVNDGYFEWSTVESGTYKFRLENFPYQEVKIDADFSTA